MDHKIVEQADQYFSTRLTQYGDSIMSLDWNSRSAQEIRFEQLTKVIRKTPDHFSICDYGCGLGDYNTYLSREFQSYDYHGYDVSESMINMAKSKHPGQCFTIGAQIKNDFDYLVASGIFSVKQSIPDGEWEEYILETLNMFHKHTEKGFAFNCLTKYSDQEHMKDCLYYADPLMLFDYCKRNFSRNVALLHDYELYDFTILVRKEAA